MGEMLDKIRKKQAEAGITLPRQAERRDRRARHKGRLPDGARFNVFYSAAAEKWSGQLLIWSEEIDDLIQFFAEAGGVFGLLDKLDDLYRKWLTEHKPAEPKQ